MRSNWHLLANGEFFLLRFHICFGLGSCRVTPGNCTHKVWMNWASWEAHYVNIPMVASLLRVTCLTYMASETEHLQRTAFIRPVNYSPPWWWRQYAPLKRWSTPTRLNGIISRKANIFILAAMRKLYLTQDTRTHIDRACNMRCQSHIRLLPRERATSMAQ
jgi:hypothetical protein